MTSPWTFYRFTWRLGPKWFLRGVEFMRGREWPEALDHSGIQPGHKVLDIGSASFSLFPLYLAASKKYRVHFTDISERVRQHEQTLRSSGMGDVLQDGHAVVEVQDARKLSYADGSFDTVFAVSTIEHIPGRGDVEAVKEIARVLRPGGTAVISVPCGPQFRDETLDEGLSVGLGIDTSVKQLFRRRRTGRQVFFQRRYDMASIEERLVKPSGLSLAHTSFLQTRFLDLRGLWGGRPAAVKAGTNWMTPLLSSVFVKVSRDPAAVDRFTEAAVLVLRKVS